MATLTFSVFADFLMGQALEVDRWQARPDLLSAPLSAIVTVDGHTVTVEGTKAEWMAGIAPDTDREEVRPDIRSRIARIKA